MFPSYLKHPQAPFVISHFISEPLLYLRAEFSARFTENWVHLLYTSSALRAVMMKAHGKY